MNLTSAVVYKSPLHKMTQSTPTRLWNDSAAIKDFADSIEHGAVGATYNPVIALGVVKKDPRLKEKNQAVIQERPAATEGEIAWRLVQDISVQGAALVKPIFDRGWEKRKGFRSRPIPDFSATPRQLWSKRYVLANWLRT